MSPAMERKLFATVVKFIMLISLSAVSIFILLIGNFLTRGLVFLFIVSAALFYIWRRRHLKPHEYDEVGYWSGLEDFELGIDYHCFHDLEITDEDLDLFPGDFYDSRPV